MATLTGVTATAGANIPAADINALNSNDAALNNAKLEIADLDDTPANDAETAVTSQHVYNVETSRAYMYRSVDEGIASGSPAQYQFNSTRYDGLSEVSGATFTATATGHYSIKAIAKFKGLSDTKQASCYIDVGGGAIAPSDKELNSFGSAFDVVCDVSIDYDVTKGQAISMYVEHDEGSTINVQGVMSIHRFA